MRPIGRALGGLALAAMILGGPFAYRWYRERNFRNFREVHRGVLYRSGQLSPDGLERVCHDHGIRTVISLRDAHSPGERPPDWEEEQFCRKLDIFFYRLPPKCWWAP